MGTAFYTLIMKNILLYIFFLAIIVTPMFITIETENDSELIECFTGFVSFTICTGAILRNVFAINKTEDKEKDEIVPNPKY